MKAFWRTAPPFVDAYQNSPWFDKPYNPTKAKALEDLKQSMKNIASEWGTHSIGEQVLRTGEPLKVEDKFVFAWGYVTLGDGPKEKTIKYVLIGKRSPWDEDAQIVEHEYPSDWDVT